MGMENINSATRQEESAHELSLTEQGFTSSHHVQDDGCVRGGCEETEDEGLFGQ